MHLPAESATNQNRNGFYVLLFSIAEDEEERKKENN